MFVTGNFLMCRVRNTRFFKVLIENTFQILLNVNIIQTNAELGSKYGMFLFLSVFLSFFILQALTFVKIGQSPRNFNMFAKIQSMTVCFKNNNRTVYSFFLNRARQNFNNDFLLRVKNERYQQKMRFKLNGNNNKRLPKSSLL